jgi:LysR family transcriptional activator of nhaA
MAAGLRGSFPRSLDGAPLLLPTYGTALRRALDHWLQLKGLKPRVVAEYDDGALMTIAAADGLGVLPVPTVAEREAVDRYHFRRVGQTESCRQEFFAVSAERRLTDPAVVAITSGARGELFGPSTRRRR